MSDVATPGLAGRLAEIAGVLGAIAASLGTVWKVVVSPLLKVQRRRQALLERLAKSCEKIDELTVQVERLCREIAASEGRFRALVISMDLACWESDPEGLCTWTSPQNADLMGLTPEQALGWGWINGVHMDDRAEVRREWEAAVGEKRQFSWEYRVGTRTFATVQAMGYPNQDSRGNVIGFVGTLKQRPNVTRA